MIQCFLLWLAEICQSGNAFLLCFFLLSGLESLKVLYTNRKQWMCSLGNCLLPQGLPRNLGTGPFCVCKYNFSVSTCKIYRMVMLLADITTVFSWFELLKVLLLYTPNLEIDPLNQVMLHYSLLCRTHWLGSLKVCRNCSLSLRLSVDKYTAHKTWGH